MTIRNIVKISQRAAYGRRILQNSIKLVLFLVTLISTHSINSVAQAQLSFLTRLEGTEGLSYNGSQLGAWYIVNGSTVQDTGGDRAFYIMVLQDVSRYNNPEMPYLDTPPQVLRYLIDCDARRYFTASTLNLQDGRYSDYLWQWAENIGSQILEAGGSAEEVTESIPWRAVFSDSNIELLYDHVCSQYL